MEIPKMDASRAKARLTRKSRPSEGGRGAKAARPVHPTKGVAGRAPRVVKARAGRPPIPANDTLPLPADEMGLPALPEVEIEVPENAAAPEGEEAVETDGTEAEAALAGAETSDAARDDDDADEDEEEATVERRRGDDEPASFLAMYFRDMAELDVL